MQHKFEQKSARHEKVIQLLHIEDDFDDVYLIHHLLAEDIDCHYSITHAEDFCSAATALKNSHYDLILLDLSVDTNIHLEALQYALNLLLDQDQNIPVVVLTGTNDNALGEQAISLGASDYLPKQHATKFHLTRSIRHSLERHRLHKEILRQARYDELTGLLNRAETLRRCHIQLELCRRQAFPLAFCLIDINDFKATNDTYCHLTGDEILRFVGSRLRQHVRTTDIVGRLGGDEFLILLNDCQTPVQLQQTIQNLKNNIEDGVPCFIQHKIMQIPITISMGVARYTPPESLRNTIAITDRLMYESKRNKGEIRYSH